MAGDLEWKAAETVAVLGWLLSPVITLLLPKILVCLGFDASNKLLELGIHIIPELKKTLQAVDQERMMQRGKRVKTDLDALDKMAAMLRHALEDAEDIFDDAQHKIVLRQDLKFPNLGRLISLQTLPGFTVSNEQGYEIRQLRDLKKLRRLVIRGLENVKSKEEALEANLAAKERLTKLTLESGGGTRCSPEVEAEVLAGLCPPVGLQKLVIHGYRGSRYPDWMVGKQSGGPEGLRNLHLGGCSQLGPGPEFEAFPHLRVLEICYCSWDSLPGNMEHLTLLKKLYIIPCENIRSLPTLPQSIELLYLASCNDELMESCKTAGHPNWQKIEHIPRKLIG